MKKLATWLLVLCVGLFTFAGCGDEAGKGKDTKPKEKDTKTP
jgi:predicted small secreted protein